MWDILFDVSMLDHGDVIIHCPREDLADELFRVFSENGVHWAGVGNMDDTRWEINGEGTCYRVNSEGALRYGNKECYSESGYDYCTKCTFYGGSHDFDVASEDEILSLLLPGKE